MSLILSVVEFTSDYIRGTFCYGDGNDGTGMHRNTSWLTLNVHVHICMYVYHLGWDTVCKERGLLKQIDDIQVFPVWPDTF